MLYTDDLAQVGDITALRLLDENKNLAPRFSSQNEVQTAKILHTSYLHIHNWLKSYTYHQSWSSLTQVAWFFSQVSCSLRLLSWLLPPQNILEYRRRHCSVAPKCPWKAPKPYRVSQKKLKPSWPRKISIRSYRIDIPLRWLTRWSNMNRANEPSALRVSPRCVGDWKWPGYDPNVLPSELGSLEII